MSGESAASLFARQRTHVLRTGIAPLDTAWPLLRAAAAESESRAKRRRMGDGPASRDDGRVPQSGNGLQNGDVVEIIGQAGTGKTAFLTEALAMALLPSQFEVQGRDGARKIHIGGGDGSAVLVDCDGRFNVLRLTARLIGIVIDASGAASSGAAEGSEGAAGPGVALFGGEDARDAFVQSCLDRLSVVTCGSTAEYLVALRITVPELVERRRAGGEGESVHLVAVEGGAASYFWRDRREQGSQGRPEQRRSMLRYSVPDAVTALSVKCKVPIIVATPAFFRDLRKAGEALGGSWTRRVTCRAELAHAHSVDSGNGVLVGDGVVRGLWRWAKPASGVEYAYALDTVPKFILA